MKRNLTPQTKSDKVSHDWLNTEDSDIESYLWLGVTDAEHETDEWLENPLVDGEPVERTDT